MPINFIILKIIISKIIIYDLEHYITYYNLVDYFSDF